MLNKLLNRIVWFLLNKSPKFLSFIVYRFPIIGKKIEFNFFDDNKNVLKDELLFSSEKQSVNETKIKLSTSCFTHWRPPVFAVNSTTEAVYLYEFRNVIVLEKDSLVINNKGISTRSFLYTSDRKTFTFFYMLSMILSKKSVKHVEEGLLIVDRYSGLNYYHWIIEAIPRYTLFLESKKNDLNIPIILSEDSPPFIFETLKLLNPNQEIIWVKSNENLKVKKLYCIDQLRGSGHFNKSTYITFKNLFFSNIILNDFEEDYRGVYVTRTMNGRKIANENELLSIFKDFKIRIVNFEGMNVSQQISIMSKSTILIGVHGANLTNGIFMPENSKVIEITTLDKIVEPQNRYCYYTLFGSIDYIYCPILGESINSEDFNAEIYVKPEYILEALKI